MSGKRVWFITGTSSGFGLEMTKHVLEKGDIAVATLRKPEVVEDLKKQYASEQLLVLKVDVTIPEDIIHAFQTTKEKFGRLDVVVNNAGYAVLGEVEGTPDDAARAMFEVNFWGSVHVAQEAVKLFRDVNAPGTGGRLIQISSGTGIIGHPSVGFYSATKHAIEGLTETLAKELDPAWNIKVTLVPLGAFATSAVSVGMVKLLQHPAYTNPALPSVLYRQAILASTGAVHDPLFEVKGDTAKAVKVLYRLSELSSPPMRLFLGKDVLDICRDKLARVLEDVEEYASWSEGLDKDL
ncbi:NAD-P-binding protein [Daedaleopsis nitida]|nr:NAD-P-binding protein [Daedaleopsis nitida]